jgi:cobalt transport protein ATP-binding subunit
VDHCVIQIDALSFHYPDGHAALDNISFAIASNEKVALIGPNGAGKSTVLLHLNGILRSSEGNILVNGLPLTDANLGQIRAWVGMVFQNPDDQLFSPRVYQDVAFGPLHMGLPDDQVKWRVEQALAAVDMSNFANRTSFHLSVGEKKRIAVATVLSMEPKILALDEPSAGLDPRARRNLIRLLGSLDHQALLISTHDMRLAAVLCSRVIVLDQGRVVASGPSAEILNNRELMESHGLETP